MFGRLKSPDSAPSSRRPAGRRLAVIGRAFRTHRTAIDPLHTSDRPDETFELAWRSGLKHRALLVLGMVALWGVTISARLVQLQVFQHDDMLAKAKGQQEQRLSLPAKRGDILDRHGEMLAYSVDGHAIGAYPREIVDPAKTVAALCAALRDCTAKDDMLGKVTGKGFKYLRRSRGVSESQAARVEALKLPGITVSTESHRYYPKMELAAHVLGEVGDDNIGLNGIEGTYDPMIRGREGQAFVLVDSRKHGLQTRVVDAPTAGASLELTIDQYIQHIAERELAAGVQENRAAGGSVVVMDPRTGEILALANYPTFNPNTFYQYGDDALRDRALQDVYEPGSTFKIVTASAALQEGVLTTSDLIDTNPGYITIGKRRIEDAEGRNHGVLSFEDVIVLSSNVGAIKIGLRVGADRISRYIRRFGFGQRLSPDLRGESAGLVHPPASDGALASMSMGYEVSVTALQMATAVSAVANGGTLNQPHLVRAVIRDGRRELVEPTELREAVRPETAATVTSIMEDVVRRGTGTKAQLDGYQVAGKTGTAYKAIPGGYSKTDYNASFVGFVPSRQPALTIVVVIDTPRGASYFGGEVAAPIFRRIAEATLRQLGVPRTINPTPPIVIRADAADEVPTPVRTMSVIPNITMLGGRPLMPDLHGLSAREALRVLSAVGLSAQVQGSGLVTGQSPAPGEPIDAGGWGVLQLRRVEVDARAAGSGGQ